MFYLLVCQSVRLRFGFADACSKEDGMMSTRQEAVTGTPITSSVEALGHEFLKDIFKCVNV